MVGAGDLKHHEAESLPATGIRTGAISDSGSCHPLDHIFVINLEDTRGKIRREHALREFHRAGIVNFDMWPAVDKNTIDYDTLVKVAEPIRTRDGSKAILRGEMALAMSHKQLYDHVVSSRFPCALIFEDDFSLGPGFKDHIERLNLPKAASFDLIKLDWCDEKTKTTMNSTPTLVSQQGGPCASGYVISFQGAEFLAKANTPVWMNADGIMDPEHIKHSNAINRTFRVFHVSPMLSWQDCDDGGTGGRQD